MISLAHELFMSEYYTAQVASDEVVHARNVIAFFVWAWPSRFCD